MNEDQSIFKLEIKGMYQIKIEQYKRRQGHKGVKEPSETSWSSEDRNLSSWTVLDLIPSY